MNDTHYKILIVEDMPTDVELTKREVQKVLSNCTYRVVQTEEDFLKELTDFAPDIVLSDYNMPSFDGLTAVRLAKIHSPVTPVIIVTGSVDEETAVECMKSGAANYVIKEQIIRLGTAIIRALEDRKHNIERLIAQNALIESEARYKSLFNLSPVAIILQNADGIVIDVNETFTTIMGYSREEMVGNSIAKITPPEKIGQINTDLERIKRGGILKQETAGVRNDGEIVNVELIESNIILPNGADGIMTIIADITARKKYEQELIVAKETAEEMNRLKTSFLANMCHELRTPMTGIIGYSDLLSEDEFAPTVVEYAQVIHKSAKRLMDTLNLILDLSKIEADKLEISQFECDASEIVTESFNIFLSEAKRKNLTFELIKPPHRVPAIIDERVFSHICINLINNAVKFTTSGGVKVELGEVSTDQGKNLTLKVQDTGIGIAKHNQMLIFEEFRQVSEGIGRNFEGTGLGLTVTKKFVEKLKGEILLESEPGVGTTFTVIIPIALYSTKKENI
ncbi:MAG: PAS domain S-box protein [Ignavibacteriaceae bacterium]|nr:PAS domain S-box protein [Ignavibacteriaceae bacterium]